MMTETTRNISVFMITFFSSLSKLDSPQSRQNRRAASPQPNEKMSHTELAETAESKISLQSERCRLERKTYTFGKLLEFEILLRLWR